ncbi:DUF4173 domain-containing protein [Polaribacter aestuariivivens]|uniref:DUF4173 domain-containing protein n=1 Tax=Polaribacter aestuariivivens TaxID=2304626 RepID=A0A5S3N3Z5_9FLAO|nr:DUF4153 domain-containing protein [Polaribacter aestuariivivens]TMM29522.1 DUF4173 domain-containing protein [Polaribacter aestuariivivens]
MKNFITLISAILFSILFYQKNIGLNLSLFTLLTIVVLAFNNLKTFKNRDNIIKAFAYLITGIMVFLYKSELAIIANIIVFFTFVGSTSEQNSSIYVKCINGVYTTIVSAFSHYFDTLNTEVENIKKKKINYGYWFKIIGIPTIVLIIFIQLYRFGNPKFDELISKIDFSFVNFHWLLFTGLGYYLFYNITNPIKIEPLTSNDFSFGNELEKNDLTAISPKKLQSEKQLAIVLMSLLNILITLFIITDVMYVFELHKMVASQLSNQVHTGVNALIISNILAIIIILYFFRGNLNFIKKNKDLKLLTFTWIFLNLAVVIITVIKNIEYIVSFGLTYKRIGVIFFLIATSVGLITTFVKVTKIKNLRFLFRKNTQVAFVILILASTINWDKIITSYNLNYSDEMDLKYLIKLSNNNTYLLKDYIENHEVSPGKERSINYKYNLYITDLKNNSWQEIVYDNFKFKK